MTATTIKADDDLALPIPRLLRRPAAARGDSLFLVSDGARLLEGFRGAPAAEMDRLCETIVAIGNAALALGPRMAALEVNPLCVDGSEIEALDGLTLNSNQANQPN